MSNFSGVKVHCTQVNCKLDHVDVDLSREKKAEKKQRNELVYAVDM